MCVTCSRSVLNAVGVGDMAKAISAFFHEGASRNAARSFKTGLQHWAARHALRFDASITPPATVMQFILDHVEWGAVRIDGGSHIR